jgi:serine/threonine protein kinase
MSSDQTKVYLNRYKALRLLGKGNFGQVYLVEDLKAAKDKSPYALHIFASTRMFTYVCIPCDLSVLTVYADRRKYLSE